MQESKKVDVEQNNIEDLFEQYIAICNKAIDKHKNEFPYREILGATEAIIGKKALDIAIYDDLAKGAFSLKFKDKKLVKDGFPSDIDKAWRMNLSYIKNVVDNPSKYIENPEKLDFDWLKSRGGF